MKTVMFRMTWIYQNGKIREISLADISQERHWWDDEIGAFRELSPKLDVRPFEERRIRS